MFYNLHSLEFIESQSPRPLQVSNKNSLPWKQNFLDSFFSIESFNSRCCEISREYGRGFGLQCTKSDCERTSYLMPTDLPTHTNTLLYNKISLQIASFNSVCDFGGRGRAPSGSGWVITACIIATVVVTALSCETILLNPPFVERFHSGTWNWKHLTILWYLVWPCALRSVSSPCSVRLRRGRCSL